MSRFAALAVVATVLLTPAEAAPESSGALRHVLALAGRIGPRKSGSEAERHAADYVRAQLEAAGLEVSLQEVTVLAADDGERAVGCRNVIGRLPGASPDTIVLAAHHDTRNARVPGANDDASGVAVLLEAARLAAREPRRSTLLFISFCGEEEGLLGSRFFVEGADLSRVRAAISLELLADGELLIGPVPGPPPLWAQRALLRAARRASVRQVAARPIWTLVPRFTRLPFSSDHESFLEKGIPAALLMAPPRAWSYHTEEDSVASVRPRSLDRAVGVADALLRDLEETPPQGGEDPHYLPLVLFGQGAIVPSAALRGLAAAALGGVLLLALSRLRIILSPAALGETLRVLIVTGAATLLGLTGLFASEALMERVHGVRFPWMAHQRLHVVQALVLALLTSWLGLKLFRRIKPTIEPGPYLAAALLIPAAGTAAALRLGWPEVAGILALPALAFLLSRFFASVTRKLALGVLGAVPFGLLFTLGDYRTAIDLGGFDLPGIAVFGALFAAVFPFVLYLAHVASFQDCLHSPFWWWMSGRGIGWTLLAASVALLGVNALRPAYTYRHRQVIEVRQRVDLKERRAEAMLHSSDSLDGVVLAGLGGRAVRGRDTTERFAIPFPDQGLAFEAATITSAAGPESLAVTCTTRLTAPRAPNRVTYRFTSRSGFRVPARDTVVRYSYAFTRVAPSPDPVDTFDLLLPEGGDLAVSLRADFEEDLLGLGVSGGPRVFVHRGAVVAAQRLVGAEEAGPASPLAAPR
jgi:hypothetical protein